MSAARNGQQILRHTIDHFVDPGFGDREAQVGTELVMQPTSRFAPKRLIVLHCPDAETIPHLELNVVPSRIDWHL